MSSKCWSALYSNGAESGALNQHRRSTRRSKSGEVKMQSAADNDEYWSFRAAAESKVVLSLNLALAFISHMKDGKFNKEIVELDQKIEWRNYFPLHRRALRRSFGSDARRVHRQRRTGIRWNKWQLAGTAVRPLNGSNTNLFSGVHRLV